MIACNLRVEQIKYPRRNRPENILPLCEEGMRRSVLYFQD